MTIAIAVESHPLLEVGAFVTALPRNTLGKVQKNYLRHSYRALFSDPSPT